MKYFAYIFAGMALLMLGFNKASAQSVHHHNVTFEIEELRIFNDTIMLIGLRFQSDPMTAQGLRISGQGTLSLCSCYCDSIWDAWPSNVGPNGILGKGTLSFASTSGSGGAVLFNPATFGQGGNTRHRGTLGMQEVAGGIIRQTEFVLPITFRMN